MNKPNRLTHQKPASLSRIRAIALFMLLALAGFSFANHETRTNAMTSNIQKFEKGNFTIYQGDALTILSTLNHQSIDAVITDPPYASGGASVLAKTQKPSQKYQGSQKYYPEFLGENRDQRSYLMWSTLWVTHCFMACKPGAPLLTFSDWRQLPVTTDYVQAGGFSYAGIVSWDKTESVRPAKGQFRAQCEYVTYGFKGQPNRDANPVYLAGAIRERVDPRKKLHMTGKPIPVMDHLVKIAPPGGVVLDPFMGSASTGIAALNSGRQFIGIEASEEYFEIAKARLLAA